MDRVHPITAAVYFAAVILITAIVQSPVFSAAALVCSVCYALCVNARTALKMLGVMLPLLLMAFSVNIFFNNQGSTELIKLPTGNSLTLESLLYSAFTCAAAASLVLWFASINRCLTSDKMIYLFSKILPYLGLLLSMTLRAVPAFARRVKQTAAAQRFVGNDIYSGKPMSRIKSGVRVLSAAVTDSLEKSVYTARSMKYRGYATAKRTAYSVFCFTAKDGLILLFTVICTGVIIASFTALGAEYRYYPSVILPFNAADIAADTAWLLLCLVPTVSAFAEKTVRRER